MPDKPHFIMRRRTLNLSQFELQIPYSYEECFKLLTASDKLSNQHIADVTICRYYFPEQQSSVTIRQVDDSAEFELHYEGAQINGTFYPITSNKTLFVGIARFGIEAEEPYFHLGMLAIVLTCSVMLYMVLSIWGVLIVLGYAAAFYIPARFHIEKSVQNLVEILTPVWSRR